MKINMKQWQPWVELVTDPYRDDLRVIIESVINHNKKYSLLAALALSCAKWIHISKGGTENDTGVICGLCGLGRSLGSVCRDCLIVTEDNGCSDFYFDWYNVRSKENAIKFRDYLLGLYKEEYEKVIG